MTDHTTSGITKSFNYIRLRLAILIGFKTREGNAGHLESCNRVMTGYALHTLRIRSSYRSIYLERFRAIGTNVILVTSRGMAFCATGGNTLGVLSGIVPMPERFAIHSIVSRTFPFSLVRDFNHWFHFFGRCYGWYWGGLGLPAASHQNN